SNPDISGFRKPGATVVPALWRRPFSWRRLFGPMRGQIYGIMKSGPRNTGGGYAGGRPGRWPLPGRPAPRRAAGTLVAPAATPGRCRGGDLREPRDGRLGDAQIRVGRGGRSCDD